MALSELVSGLPQFSPVDIDIILVDFSLKFAVFVLQQAFLDVLLRNLGLAHDLFRSVAFLLDFVIGLLPVSAVVLALGVFGGSQMGEIFFGLVLFEGLFLVDHGRPDIELFFVEIIRHVVFILVVLDSHLVVAPPQ
jgi:hypothetical protein